MGRSTGDEVLYGYIDEDGEEVIPCEYDIADDFMKNGLAIVKQRVVEDKDGSGIYKAGLINDKDEIILPFEYYGLYYADDNMERLEVKKEIDEDVKTGIMDLAGNIVLPIEYDLVGRYGDNDWAAVGKKIEGTSEKKPKYDCGYVDMDGEIVMKLPDTYIYADSFVKVK